MSGPGAGDWRAGDWRAGDWHAGDWHRLDPVGPHAAAPALGRLVAKGVLERGWALEALLASAAALRPPQACPSGVQMRLTHRLDAAIREHETRRRWVERDMVRAVQAALRERRLPADVEQAAHDADPGGAFLPADRLAVAHAACWAAAHAGVVKLHPVV